MKNLILAFAFLATTAIAFAGQSLTGKWQLEQNVQGNIATVAFDLAEDGEKLSGVITLPEGKKTEITGKRADGKIVFQYPTEWEGQVLIMVYRGTLDAKGELVGTVEVQPLGVPGEFTAKRATEKSQ